jgi:integrase
MGGDVARIDLKGERAKLPVRREPYWAVPLATNCSFGFRRIDSGGTWIARYKGEDGRRTYHRLGRCTDSFDYYEARDAALKWFKDKEHGVVSDDVTVETACKAYVEDRRTEKSEKNARDAEKRFVRCVYNTAFGKTRLTKLRSAAVKAWRNNLIEPITGKRGVSKSTANRTTTTLKAALNLAVKNRLVTVAARIEWSSVPAYKGAGKRREIFLDLAQRRALIKAASGAVRDLIEAATLTGARPGELVNATRSQFDARTGSMTFTGKDLTRTVPLSPAAVKLFKRLAQDKLPGVYLLPGNNGKRWLHSGWDALVREAAKKAGLLPGTCMYVLRHSWITEAITSAQMTTLDVAKLTGTSVVQIENHYGHLVNSHVRAKLAVLVMA